MNWFLRLELAHKLSLTFMAEMSDRAEQLQQAMAFFRAESSVAQRSASSSRVAVVRTASLKAIPKRADRRRSATAQRRTSALAGDLTEIDEAQFARF